MSIPDHPYLKDQLITYIGNKRRLLPLIYEALEGSSGPKDSPVFHDLFAGSGVVSRLAKLIGYKVVFNDWEPYSRILGSSHLSLNNEDIPVLFGSEKELSKLLEEINNLPFPSEDKQYMALYYAPSHNNIDAADYRTERLFYTRENALRIDATRQYIEDRFPADSDENTRKIRDLLIGLLLSEASKHTNTSGVFKAYHKGFGGHGKDALKRILSPISLKYPVLLEQKERAEVYCSDANHLVKQLSRADVVYLDPPYNQHQYGSNYHILNTIALWDKIPAPKDLNEKGELKAKAAIRKDWINTRSSYCSKKTAISAFSDLMENIDSRRILISYSNDGLIPFEEMLNICETKGKLQIVSNEYTKFRGGRQSNQRLHSNIEFILCIDCDSQASRSSRNKIYRLLLHKEMALMEKKIYDLEIWKDSIIDSRLILPINNRNLELEIKKGAFIQIVSDISQWSIRDLRKAMKCLRAAACTDRFEEIKCLINLAEHNMNIPLKDISKRLRMLAHKKTQNEFRMILSRLESSSLDLSLIAKDLDSIKTQAEKRLIV